MGRVTCIWVLAKERSCDEGRACVQLVISYALNGRMTNYLQGDKTIELSKLLKVRTETLFIPICLILLWLFITNNVCVNKNDTNAVTLNSTYILVL